MTGLVAVILTLSPLTGSARVSIAALLGVLGAAGWLLMRLREEALPTRGGETRLAIPTLPSIALIASALLAFAPTLLWLVAQHTDNIWQNAHGLFVPFFMILMARSTLHQSPPDRDAEASVWGLPVLALAAILLALDAGMKSHLLSALALAIALPGLSLVLLGAERTRRLALPLALGIFLIPLPDRIGDPLGISIGTAVGSGWILHMLEAPVLRHGTLFLIGEYPFEVSQNCSGLTAAYGTLGFAIMLCAGTRGAARRMLLLAIPVIATIAANAVRCAVLIYASSKLGPAIVHHPVHGLSGVAAYWFVLALLWLVCDRQSVLERLR